MPEKEPTDAQPLQPGLEKILEEVAARNPHPAYARTQFIPAQSKNAIVQGEPVTVVVYDNVPSKHESQ